MKWARSDEAVAIAAVTAAALLWFAGERERSLAAVLSPAFFARGGRGQFGGSETVAETSASSKHAVRIEPMEGKTMGAHVYGYDPTQHVHNLELAAELRDALEQHLVLVFHNVSDALSPENHVALSRHLGPVDPLVSGPPSYLRKGVFNSPDQVQRALAAGAKLEDLGSTMLRAADDTNLPVEVTRIVKEPTDPIAFGEGWHSDLTFHTATPFAAVLVARQLPTRGGNTHFADMRAVYDSLPAAIKTEIEGLESNHTDGHENWASHPVVRHDHRAGRRSLFVNKAFSRYIIGARPGLLDELLEAVERVPSELMDAFLDISWSDGQVVMWDNRFTQHAAQADYVERREMHRTVVSGTVPY